MLVLQRHGDVLQLVLDGNLQFQSDDERSYHDALVMPVVEIEARSVLIIGGGDGLAARTLLEKLPSVRIVLVDIDRTLLRLFTRHPRLRALNRDSLQDPRVRVIGADGLSFICRCRELFDGVILDLPDPDAPRMDRLYVPELVGGTARRLATDGLIVTQAAVVGSKAHGAIRQLFESAGLSAAVHVAPVPSFGGPAAFVVAKARPREPNHDRSSEGPSLRERPAGNG
jgi:spermidine synthase